MMKLLSVLLLVFGQYCYQDAVLPPSVIHCPEGSVLDQDCKAAADAKYLASMNLLIDLACIAQTDVYDVYWPEMDAHAQAYQDCVAANQGQVHQVDCFGLYTADVNDTNQWLADEIAKIDADFNTHANAIIEQYKEDLGDCCREQ